MFACLCLTADSDSSVVVSARIHTYLQLADHRDDIQRAAEWVQKRATAIGMKAGSE